MRHFGALSEAVKNCPSLKVLATLKYVVDPSPRLSRRDRRKQETIDDIKAAARQQLASAGPAGVSLRGIARELGMTASAVHYYFPAREALLDALAIDGCESLAACLRASYHQAGQATPDERWVAVCRAHRSWALSRPSEYLLLYGHDGRAARQPHPHVAQAMASVTAVLLTMMKDAVASGYVDAARIEAVTPPRLREQLAAWRGQAPGLGNLPLGALAACMIGFAELHGAITLELTGHVPPQLTDAAALFDLRMAHIAASLHPAAPFRRVIPTALVPDRPGQAAAGSAKADLA
jgi:AcrR family transcriptional regulator